MVANWQDVRCASLPAESLSALADLRREPGIRVTIEGGRAWVSWDDGPGSERTRRIWVERLLLLAGVEIFSNQGGRWYRPGERLPAFEVPVIGGPTGVSLERVILPAPLEILPPADDPPRSVPLRLVRDDRGRPRPASALRCRLRDLSDWIDRAPSAWIESISGAWCPPAGGDPAEAEVVLLGPAVRLPRPSDSVRYWGEDVLIPIGYRAEPELAGSALREAIGAGTEELVVLDEQGPELIPRDAVRPMSRASLRLARSGVGAS